MDATIFRVSSHVYIVLILYCVILILGQFLSDQCHNDLAKCYGHSCVFCARCVRPKMNMDATISAEPKFRLSGFRNANYFLAFQTCVFMCIMD